MPAYDLPIEFNLGPRPPTEKFAAVLEFDSVDRERIQRFLDSLATRGITTRVANVRAYNPDHTSPELYFP